MGREPATAAHPLRAELLLTLAAVIWGFAFVAQRAGMESVGPFLFNGIRFALGSLCLVPLWLRRRRALRRAASGVPPAPRGVLAAGAVTGILVFLGASLQQVGLVHTTAGKAGFITGLYVVLVPILESASGRRLGAGAWCGAVAATLGLYLLSVRGGLALDPGDALVLGGAVVWSVHVLVVGRWSPRFEPLELAILQFATCSVLSLATALAREALDPRGVAAAGIPILYAGVLSVGVAYTLQVVAQRDAHPTAAAILMSLEAVFAAVGGFLFLGETLSGRAAAGCALMLGGVLLSVLGGRPRGARRSRIGRRTGNHGEAGS